MSRSTLPLVLAATLAATCARAPEKEPQPATTAAADLAAPAPPQPADGARAVSTPKEEAAAELRPVSTAAPPKETASAPKQPAKTPGTATRPAVSESRLRSQVASWKKAPYRDNGTTKEGIGNAGFVKAIVKGVFEVELPSKVDDQMRTGKLVELAALEPGDLVFFEGKGIGPFRSRSVGIFLGREEVALANKDLGVATVRLTDSRWRASFKTGRRVSSPSTAEAPTFDPAAYGANRAALLKDVAKAWVGTLYKQDGTTFEGIGNDEFVRSIYEAINDDELDGTPKQWIRMGRAVKQSNLEPGDIILYEAVGIGKIVNQRHAGMYIGGGEFVHAVKGSAVTISKLDDPRWSKAFRAARRIEPAADLETASGSAAAAKGPAGSLPAKGAASVSARAVSDPERRLRQATESWLGTPYKLGGNTKAGVDCSAFVRAVYTDAFGVELPRTAEEQERLGRKVDRKNLETGDLVFFRTKGMGPFFKSRHVGVYLGGGEFAQASGRQGVNVTPLSNRYWSKKYDSARRLSAN